MTATTANAVDAWLVEYRAHVEPLGARVERVADSKSAAEIIDDIAGETQTGEIIVSAEAAGAGAELLAELGRIGVGRRIAESAEDARDQRLGISLARRAIAETGSILLAEPTLAERSTAMLTRVNIAICRTSDLVPSLVEAAAELRSIAMRPGGGYATLMTGPSRTADIEMSLTVGVQGPARVVTIFVDSLS